MGNEQDPSGAGAAGDGKTDVEKLVAQVAQLSEAMKAKDAQFDTLKETYERTNALLQTMMDNGGRAGGAQGGNGGAGSRGGELKLSRDYAGEFQIPNEAVQAIVQETMKVAEERFDGRFIQMQEIAKQRDAFYKNNPDLVGSEFLVGSISVQIDQEFPNKSKEEKFKLVAERTRQTIKRYQDANSDGDRNPDQPIGGANNSRDGEGSGDKGGGGETPLTPDAELAAEVADRNKMRSQRSRR